MDKYETIKSQRDKNPEEFKFSENYLRLTEGTIDLADSVLTDFMKSIKQDSFDYLSHDRRITKIYEGLKAMHQLGLSRTRHSKQRKLINNKLKGVVDTRNPQEWTTQTFKDKSQIESLAEVRQIQTTCYEMINIIFDELLATIEDK